MSALSPAVRKALARIEARNARLRALSENDLRLLLAYLSGLCPDDVDAALADLEDRRTRIAPG